MIGHAAVAAAALLAVTQVAHGQERDREQALVELDREPLPTLSYRLAEHWSYGGAVEIDSIAQRNFDLDSAGADNLATLDPRVDIGLAYAPQDDLHFYAQAEIARGMFLQDESDTRSDDSRVRLRQAYLTMAGPRPGLSFQIGRQRFEDERAWWYDEDLDAVSLFYRTGRIGLELSASRNETVGDDVLDRERARRGNNLMAVGHYAYGGQAELAAYLIAQDNRSEPREKPVFLGLRSIGAIGPAIEHWIDAAIVRGTDDGRDIRAWGFDAGAEYHFDAPLWPALHLGVAFGSGDGDLLDGVDEEFRQTGLQNSYFYYGEVLAPELSNLWIYTAGIELEPASDASIRILFHHYQQDRATAELRDTLIDRDPDGVSRELGQALDVAVSYEGIENVYVDLIAGVFFPGAAFGPGTDRAVFGQLLITYEFW
jgi:alginate production protein